MSWAAITACLWALAATLVALLPWRWQFPPGIALLIAAPFLLVWLGVAHGIWVALIALLAFVSMFRRPLAYFARRAMGRAGVGQNGETTE